MSSSPCSQPHRASIRISIVAFTVCLGSCSSSAETESTAEDILATENGAQSAAGQLQGQSANSPTPLDASGEQEASDTEDATVEDETGQGGDDTAADDTASADEGTEPQGAAEESGDSDPLANTPYVIFEDPQTGFRTTDFYDADRQLFHFHLANETLVRADGDIPQRNWVTSGNELGPNGIFGSYRIRFGTEGGEARAYFTEVNPPTICNLVLDQPNGLSIFRGTETPPMN